ncbi:junctional adhesion molecule C-like [Scleropages formosus]|uniref:Junctional adhesion molecule 3 n=1 Tax=Scleropages formosus TaxID=113540 RepID=A0A8C9QWQ1_SCLFO|nr:junctional adhesion molecule C-like [Scleropages formosus]
MAARCRAAAAVLIISIHLCITTFAVILRTTNKSPWANEFESIELSCLIESISTNNPRIEWKKIKNGEPSYVYFEKHISRDLENRAYIKEPATLVITNLTRSDTAQYRCEVTAHMDHKTFDEVLIDLVVRVKPVVPRCSVPKAVPVGQPAELRCTEDEAFPRPQYQWFHNQEEMAQDPKSNPKFSNSSYTINRETGTLLFTGLRKEDSGQYHCMAENDAGYAECTPQTLEVYDVNVVGIVLGMLALAGVVMVIMVGICCACKNGYFVRSREAGSNYKAPDSRDGLDYIKPEDEGGFRHKSSFVI